MRAAFAVFIVAAVLCCEASLTCNMFDYGAVSGSSDPAVNTQAFARAISACCIAAYPSSSHLWPVILLPPGIFLVASLDLSNCSNVQLRISNDAVLLGSSSESDYPLVPPWPSYGVGRDVPTSMRFRPLLYAANVSNLHITGGGIIDGNGEPWYARFFEHKLNWSRPCLVECMFCTNLTIDDLHLKDSAFWNVHPYASRHVVVRNLLITAPPWAANTDGIDPDSCSYVLIENIVVRAGDDGIAIKSGLNAAGRAFGVPCEHVTIRNVTVHPLLDNLSTNGVSIGSEMSGGVHNVSIDNITAIGVAAGIYIKSMLGRGGYVRNISYSNVILHRVLQPIKIVMKYSYDVPAFAPSNFSDVPVDVPVFDNIVIDGVFGSSCDSAGDIFGLTDVSNITNLLLRDVSINGALVDAVKWTQCEAAQGVAVNVMPQPACLSAG
jgi:polygalacturonase